MCNFSSYEIYQLKFLHIYRRGVNATAMTLDPAYQCSLKGRGYYAISCQLHLRSSATCKIPCVLACHLRASNPLLFDVSQHWLTIFFIMLLCCGFWGFFFFFFFFFLCFKTESFHEGKQGLLSLAFHLAIHLFSHNGSSAQ